MCAGLEKLVFLPAGNATLTRRARHCSAFDAVVYKGRRRKFSRVGVLIEPQALRRACEACAFDEEKRAKHRAKAAVVRETRDQEYVAAFAGAIRERFPNAPEGVEHQIAEFACEKRSGRVGRSQAARRLAAHAVDAAVTAHIRHCETRYDQLLASGIRRQQARKMIQTTAARVEARWRGDRMWSSHWA